MRRFYFGLFLVLAALIAAGSPASAQDLPVLETYRFELEGWPHVELSLLDPSIKGGRAQFRFEVRPAGKGALGVRVEVFRHVPADEIHFALLLEEVRLRFLDADGDVVKSIVLDDVLGQDGLFIIGDSNDGYFEHRGRVSGLQNARRLEVQLLGNYE